MNSVINNYSQNSNSSARVMEKSFSQNSYMSLFKKITLSQPPKGLLFKQKLIWLQERRQAGIWVECSHSHCKKFRYIPDVHDPLQLPDVWYCEMNTDTSANSCSKAEHKLSVSEEEDLIHALYSAGSLVWAQLEGFPWWPAIVDDCPDTEQYYWLDGFSDIPNYYNVTFLDSAAVTRAWVTPNKLKPYLLCGKIVKYDHPKVPATFMNRIIVAKKQANDASQLTVLERLRKYSFVTRYTGPINTPKKARDLKNLGSKFHDLSSLSSDSSSDDSEEDIIEGIVEYRVDTVEDRVEDTVEERVEDRVEDTGVNKDISKLKEKDQKLSKPTKAKKGDKLNTKKAKHPAINLESKQTLAGNGNKTKNVKAKQTAINDGNKKTLAENGNTPNVNKKDKKTVANKSNDLIINKQGNKATIKNLKKKSETVMGNITTISKRKKANNTNDEKKQSMENEANKPTISDVNKKNVNEKAMVEQKIKPTFKKGCKNMLSQVNLPIQTLSKTHLIQAETSSINSEMTILPDSEISVWREKVALAIRQNSISSNKSDSILMTQEIPIQSQLVYKKSVELPSQDKPTDKTLPRTSIQAHSQSYMELTDAEAVENTEAEEYHNESQMEETEDSIFQNLIGSDAVVPSTETNVNNLNLEEIDPMTSEENLSQKSLDFDMF